MYEFYPHPNAMTEKGAEVELHELTEQAVPDERAPQPQLSASAAMLVMDQVGVRPRNPTTEAVNQSFRLR